LEPGIEGTKLVVTGRVLTRSDRPIARTRLDLWQANDDGVYDNVDFKLRGHQFSDEDGKYRLETIVPGIYDPRTRHIHVKVLPPEGHELTTQLFFPNEPRNRTDSIFRPELVMEVRDSEDGKQATFDFVLDIE
jgi:protocatechuate 3,4-dioxygenase beta subunit